MTDLEISVQLARRVHGWKIPPDESCEKYHERQKFFNDKANYPNYDPTYKLLWREESCDGVKWNPFEDWVAAMGLAEKWRRSGARLCSIRIYAIGASCHVTAENGEFSVVNESGPRAVTMAVAKAVGIEVGE